MIGYNGTLDAPTMARYHREAVEQIVHSVEERTYCALLGPRLCGKTLLLRFIENNLAKILGWTCIFIDLEGIRAATQQEFFDGLIQQIARSLDEITGESIPLPAERASSAVFRAFLSESLEVIGRDLVLIFDPLEAVPNDLIQALLTSLRAAYMDQQMQDQQITVIVSGALSLATLTVGESSPLGGIARRIFIGDLSEADSENLVQDFLVEYGVSITKPALRKLHLASNGDIYLIRKLSQRCAELVGSRSDNRLRSRDVGMIIRRFLRKDVYRYAPLIEAIRLIEEDPDLLRCILMLMDQEVVPRSLLPLPLSPDLDPLYLTGVVEEVEEGSYRIQNSIYCRFLAEHFSPGRVGHVLAMAGRWDSAIDYLETSISTGSHGSRADLLPATINSIYASQDLAEAVHFLRRGLLSAFGVCEAQVWFRSSQEGLRLIGPAEIAPEGEVSADLDIPFSADRLEARAYRHQVVLRGQEEEQLLVRAIPLMIPGGKPIGVVTLHEEILSGLLVEQRERDLQLAGFLNQATRALGTVISRRQELTLAGRVQASLLPEFDQILGWQIAANWRPARETSGDFYDIVPFSDGKVGIVIADVVDKGMGAALLMALSRTLIRTYASDHPDHPDRVLSITNRRILTDLDAGLFVTLFYGILDPLNGRMIYSNAGHPPPYLFTSDGLINTLPGSGSMPLGLSEEGVWNSFVIEIPEGGLLLLYTDGIPEAQNHLRDFFGVERMLKIVRSKIGNSAQIVQDALISGLFGFTASEPQLDDITLLILARESNPADKE